MTGWLRDHLLRLVRSGLSTIESRMCRCQGAGSLLTAMQRVDGHGIDGYHGRRSERSSKCASLAALWTRLIGLFGECRSGRLACLGQGAQ
jgi:hypothetical protein